MGWPKRKPTPIATNNYTLVGNSNDTINQRRSKAMNMRFYWCWHQVSQNSFCVYWNPGKVNIGDYYSKHHLAKHHQMVRPIYLNEKSSLKDIPKNSVVGLRGWDIIIREMHKLLTPMNYNNGKCAPWAKINSSTPSSWYRSSNNVNNLKFSLHYGCCCLRT